MFLVFVLYPVGYGLWLARHPQSYVALVDDPIFLRARSSTRSSSSSSASTSRWWSRCSCPGFFVNTRTWIKWLSVLFILPWAVPSIPTILSIRFMLNPEWGMINQLIFSSPAEDGPNWLNDRWLALEHGDARARLEVAAVLDA